MYPLCCPILLNNKRMIELLVEYADRNNYILKFDENEIPNHIFVKDEIIKLINIYRKRDN